MTTPRQHENIAKGMRNISRMANCSSNEATIKGTIYSDKFSKPK